MQNPNSYLDHVRAQLKSIEDEGLFKSERFIQSPQSSTILLQDGREVINMCANNYLGLADDNTIIKAARESFDRYGYGMSSVRFHLWHAGLSTNSWKNKSQISWDLKTPFSTALASTQTADSSRCCLMRKMRSSATSSITHPSSTAYACVKPNVSAMPIMTWLTWRRISRQLMPQGHAYKLIATDGCFFDGRYHCKPQGHLRPR